MMLILIGLTLMIIEMYRYSKRFFGCLGAMLVFSGMLLRSLMYGFSPGMLLIMLVIIAVLLLSAHLIKLNVQKKEWLYQSIRIAVNEAQAQDDTYEFLIDCAGTAITDIDEVGKVSINDITFSVHADNFIALGEKVRITAVEGGKIFVVKENLENR